MFMTWSCQSLSLRLDHQRCRDGSFLVPESVDSARMQTTTRLLSPRRGYYREQVMMMMAAVMVIWKMDDGRRRRARKIKSLSVTILTIVSINPRSALSSFYFGLGEGAIWCLYTQLTRSPSSLLRLRLVSSTLSTAADLMPLQDGNITHTCHIPGQLPRSRQQKEHIRLSLS